MFPLQVTMSRDVAHQIVAIMDSRSAQEAADLKERTLRTLSLEVEVEDVAGGHRPSPKHTSTCVMYEHPSRGWVIEFNGARLGWEAMPTVATCLVEQVNMRIFQWLDDIDLYGTVGYRLYVHLNLTLTIPCLATTPWSTYMDVVTIRETNRIPNATRDRAADLLKAGRSVFA